MKNETTLLYDGSFNGFLTAVYIAFEERLHVVGIEKNEQGQNELFSETETIFTHVEKAKRVWNGVRQKSYNAITNIYFAYLSETKESVAMRRSASSTSAMDRILGSLVLSPSMANTNVTTAIVALPVESPLALLVVIP